MTQSDSTTRSTANETLDDARHAGADVAGSVRDSAQEAAGKISSEASRAAGKMQSDAADEVKDVASALRTAAGELRSGSPQDRAFSHLADNLADVSDAMRNKDMGQMLGELNGFARRNPLAFLGGAALVGFAATRLAKASAETPTPGTSGSSYGGSGSPYGGSGAQTGTSGTTTGASGTATPGASGTTTPRASGTLATPPVVGQTTTPTTPGQGQGIGSTSSAARTTDRGQPT